MHFFPVIVELIPPQELSRLPTIVIPFNSTRKQLGKWKIPFSIHMSSQIHDINHIFLFSNKDRRLYVYLHILITWTWIGLLQYTTNRYESKNMHYKYFHHLTFYYTDCRYFPVPEHGSPCFHIRPIEGKVNLSDEGRHSLNDRVANVKHDLGLILHDPTQFSKYPISHVANKYIVQCFIELLFF